MIHTVDYKAVNNITITTDNLSIYLIDFFDQTVTIRQDRPSKNYFMVQDNIFIKDLYGDVEIIAEK